MTAKTWFITGSSRGLGRAWAEAALERGDRVAATARRAASVEGLRETYGDRVLPLALDVTDRAAVVEAVALAHAHFGRLDVVVNNAGYGLFGAVEEVSEEDARAQIETNVFGALWVTQAVLPHLREQAGGHILQVSSMGGLQAIPNLGLYHASKWALEGFSESLAGEVAAFGIKVTLIEPGPYRTDWGGDSAVHAAPQPQYEPLRAELAEAFGTYRFADPAATGPAILAVVDAPDPPLRLLLGSQPVEWIKDVYARRMAVWEDWADVSRTADGELAPGA
jgi:NAD(P)-dependent dehydrogenase (short-subunit alcohol dehydrogenase family)